MALIIAMGFGCTVYFTSRKFLGSKQGKHLHGLDRVRGMLHRLKNFFPKAPSMQTVLCNLEAFWTTNSSSLIMRARTVGTLSSIENYTLNGI